jgi:hypothetical protein
MTRSACVLVLFAAFTLSSGCDSQTATTTPSQSMSTADSVNDGTKLVKGNGGMMIKKGPNRPKALPPIKFKSDN